MKHMKPTEQTVYFARPVSHYGTPEDRTVLDKLSRLFDRVIDPAAPEHQTAYEQRKAAGDPNAFSYFTDLVDQCHALAFRRFHDGKIGAGVYREAERAAEREKYLFEVLLDPHCYYRNIGGINLDDVLTVDETRARVHGITPIQYEYVKVCPCVIAPNDWRVEAVHKDGLVEVTIVNGPDAEARAHRIAQTLYKTPPVV